MERLEGGRIRITGVPFQRDRGLSREEELRQRIISEHSLENYFSIIRLGSNADFTPGSVFIGGQVLDAPKPRRNRIDVNINYDESYYRRRCPADVPGILYRETGDTAPIVAFQFDGGKKVRAVFYVEHKTLILGSPHYTGFRSYFSKIMSYLVEHGNLLVLPPKPAPADTTQYIRMIELHQGEQKIVKLNADRKMCTVGCDPEFELIRNGSCARPDDYRGTAKSHEIGTDGAGAQIEIRPRAYEKPSDVVSYMIGIMERFPGGEELGVVGDYAPLGGHIHVGVGSSYSPPPDLTYLYDLFLGRPTLNFSGQARDSYKRLGSYENKGYGFEYRTPPAAIFINPEIARISMKIMKTLTECFINGQVMEINERPQFEDYWNYCGLIPKEYEQWQEFLNKYLVDKTPAKNVLPAWLSDEAKSRYSSKLKEARTSPDKQRFESQIACRTQRQRPAPRPSIPPISGEISDDAPQRRIVFNDDWDERVKALFERLFVQLLPPNARPVRLFGLAATRGDNSIFGFTLEGYNTLPIESNPWRDYGLPYVIRMSTLGLSQHLVERIVRAIVAVHTGRTATDARQAASPSPVEQAAIELLQSMGVDDAERAERIAARAGLTAAEPAERLVAEPIDDAVRAVRTNAERDERLAADARTRAERAIAAASRAQSAHVDEDWSDTE